MSEIVSIITPSYNSARYIAATIESIQNQTYPLWEMLIVDDGSLDETAAIVSEICDTRAGTELVSAQDPRDAVSNESHASKIIKMLENNV